MLTRELMSLPFSEKVDYAKKEIGTIQYIRIDDNVAFGWATTKPAYIKAQLVDVADDLTCKFDVVGVNFLPKRESSYHEVIKITTSLSLKTGVGFLLAPQPDCQFYDRQRMEYNTKQFAQQKFNEEMKQLTHDYNRLQRLSKLIPLNQIIDISKVCGIEIASRNFVETLLTASYSADAHMVRPHFNKMFREREDGYIVIRSISASDINNHIAGTSCFMPYLRGTGCEWYRGTWRECEWQITLSKNESSFNMPFLTRVSFNNLRAKLSNDTLDVLLKSGDYDFSCFKQR